jgi:hypothetical protein
MRESRVEKDANDLLKGTGIKTLKLNGHGDRSKPDRLYWKAGRCAFVEYKAPGKTPTALQAKRLRETREDGTPAEWFDDATKAAEWVKGVLL